MAKQVTEFVETAKKSAEEAGMVWEDMSEEHQALATKYVIKVYYEANPEEAKEILEGEE